MPDILDISGCILDLGKDSSLGVGGVAWWDLQGSWICTKLLKVKEAFKEKIKRDRVLWSGVRQICTRALA